LSYVNVGDALTL